MNRVRKVLRKTSGRQRQWRAQLDLERRGPLQRVQKTTERATYCTTDRGFARASRIWARSIVLAQILNLYTRALLEAEFGGLSEVRITEHDSMTSEGTCHVGMAALIGLVGRK